MTTVESEVTATSRPRPGPRPGPSLRPRGPRHARPEARPEEPDVVEFAPTTVTTPAPVAAVPNSVEPPIVADEESTGESEVADVVEAEGRFRAHAAPAHGRAGDYRLRGLDLGTSAVNEASRPVIRPNNLLRRRQHRRLLGQFGAALVVLALVAAALRLWVLEPYAVGSTAMVPNIAPGTEVLVLRPGLLTGSLETGDIVMFREPAAADCARGSSDLVARVVGLPGQTIASTGTQIFVNGHVLKERGWYNPPFGELDERPITKTTIASDSYFLLGDNRTDRCDSRAFGAVPRSAVLGKVVATIARNGHPFVHGL